jgi:hypothetical protein
LPSHNEARQRRFDEVVQDVPAISREVAVDHLDDEPAVSLDHERSEVSVGDHVADERLVEVGADVGEVDLPKAPRPIEQRIGAPNAVDEHVEAPGVISDAGGEVRHLILVSVVDPQRDCATAGLLYQCNRLVDGLRAIHAFRVPCRAASRAIDDGSGFSECSCDSASSTPRRSRHQSNLAG